MSSGRREVPFSWFGKTLWKFSPIYIEIIFIAFCLRLLGLVEPFVFQTLIDRILPFERESSLMVIVAFVVFVAVLHLVFSILSILLRLSAGKVISGELGGRIYAHLFKLPLQHFSSYGVGEQIARLREVNTIHAFIVGTSSGLFLDLVFVFIYIFALLQLSPDLTFILLFSLPVQFLLYLLFGPFLRGRLRKQFDEGAKHQGRMVEAITGVPTIKSLGIEQQITERLKYTLNNFLYASYRAGIFKSISGQIMSLFSTLIVAIIIYLGSKLVFAGEITLGQLIAFHLLSTKVTAPIANFSSLWEQWQQIRISRQRLGDILGKKKELFGLLPKIKKSTATFLTFEGVSFSYDKSNIILDNIDISIKEKSLNLLIGGSGIGKSTLGKLAAGLEVPFQGVVKLGEKNIASFDPHDVRMNIAYVPQEPFLFAGTVRDNISIGLDDVSDVDILKSLKMAAFENISELPLGLDTNVGERGSFLSGGQRQRISIARSLLRFPKVIILDEPTSSLDERSQQIIIKSIEKLSESITVVVITHNPQSYTKVANIIDLELLIKTGAN